MKGHAPVPDKTVHHKITYWNCSCGHKFLGYSKRQAGISMKAHVAEMETRIKQLESEIADVRKGIFRQRDGGTL